MIRVDRFYTKHTLIQFANGAFIYPPDAELVPCIAAKDAVHGDLKSPKLRMIRKGQQCYLVCMWDNYYGQWAKVRTPDGDIDVRPSELIYNQTLEISNE